MLNFTDNVSEGTNRISASQIKVKPHKMDAPNSREVMMQDEMIKDSQVTFKAQELRRSIEFGPRNSNEIVSQNRNTKQSKSIDSHEAISTVHYMLKPKGIEVLSQSINTSPDRSTPKISNVNMFMVGKRLSEIAENKRD